MTDGDPPSSGEAMAKLAKQSDRVGGPEWVAIERATVIDRLAGAKRGLWTDPNPIPPWEYRHGGKTGSVRRSTPEQVHAKADRYR